MRLDKAMAILGSMNERRAKKATRLASNAPTVLTYQPPAPQKEWCWDDASPRERANWIRANRRNGVMDWDLCSVFDLTKTGLEAIVKGADWKAEFSTTHDG